MSRKDARTANPNSSVWLDLPEDTFRHHLVKLEERTNAVPIGPQASLPEGWLRTSPYNSQTSHGLPLEIEQQLADDFASLAAVEEGAQSVAAVCIEEHVRPSRLTLRFAALDISLNDAVKTALQEAADILAQAASDSGENSISLSKYVDVLFHHVIQLHLRRLLARLRSTKWEKPKYLSKSHKKPLWQDFANLIHRAQFVYTKREKASRLHVEELLGKLASIYERFETVQEELPALIHLVKASFTFCSREEAKDYVLRLESRTGSKLTQQVASAIKCLRQIQKIAAYRRICISLVQTAREYALLFQNGMALAYLTPYKSVPTTIGYEEWATTCHVHAEVQLAVHYDLKILHLEPGQESFLLPRCIGISKWLCYLCYQFLRAHKVFFPSRTHGRLYDQWTIPDLAEFDEDLLNRYRSILKIMDERIVHLTDNEPELWRIEPMTSIDFYSTLGSPLISQSATP